MGKFVLKLTPKREGGEGRGKEGEMKKEERMGGGEERENVIFFLLHFPTFLLAWHGLRAPW